jgi:carbamoyltransferase
MRIVGINKARTVSGKSLRHGGAALYSDGKIYAVAEERVSGNKYAGGYEQALQQLLVSTQIDLDDVDQINVSTCCEQESMALCGHPLAGDPRLVSVNHHLSHAALAFGASGFDRALVVVIDGGGNVLSDSTAPMGDWWACPREQQTYFVGDRKSGLELIGRDLSEPYDVGLGELYRAFTYWLGWSSSTNASKTMALAGHGRNTWAGKLIYEMNDGQLLLPVRNNPGRPLKVVSDVAETLGLDFGEPRTPGGYILQVHKDVATFLQRSVEEALRQKLSLLKKQNNLDKVCISGGFGLNVVANARILDIFPGGVYVPSAPADDGQCLGNVYAALMRNSRNNVPTMSKSKDAYLGPEYQIDSRSVAASLERNNLRGYVVFETSDASNLAAQMLSDGAVVCLYQNRSEFGPRALGSRSILADPRRADTVSRLNTLKARDWFMPFAPVVLEGRLEEWFEVTARSPFMSFAVQATDRAALELPAVINADGTARVQTIDGAESAGVLSRIVTRFADKTGVPGLLNTSFNTGGKPIVETIDQAMEAFGQMPVNTMIIGRFLVLKSLSPDVVDLPLAASLSSLNLAVHEGGDVRRVRTYRTNAWRTVRGLQDLTEAVVFVRTELPLYGDYLKRLRAGKKQTTIRFRKGAVEIPFSARLPLYETADFGPGDRSRPTEHVNVSAVRYWRFGELDDVDAVRDGFENVEHMRDALKNDIYPQLSDEDWVTVYDISLVQ